MHEFRHWMTVCEAAANVAECDTVPADVDEAAPPGRKAERFSKKHKREFKKRYGKRGEEVLYATAWKKFGEAVSLRDYLSLVEG